jgi:hypothetical protein
VHDLNFSQLDLLDKCALCIRTFGAAHVWQLVAAAFASDTPDLDLSPLEYDWYSSRSAMVTYLIEQVNIYGDGQFVLRAANMALFANPGTGGIIPLAFGPPAIMPTRGQELTDADRLKPGIVLISLGPFERGLVINELRASHR